MYSKTRGGKNMFLANIAWKKLGIFAGGVLFGTAGMKILGSQDAKKVYTEAAAAVLRGQDCAEECDGKEV